MAGINEAYVDIASIRDWKTLENSGTVTTAVGTWEYTPVTSSGAVPRIRRIESVIDETNARYLEEVQREAFEQKYPYIDPTAANNQGSPLYWFQSGYTPNRDIKVKVFQAPNAALTLRAVWYEEPLDLVNDADIPRIPDQWHYGLVYLGLAKYYEFQKDFVSIYYRNLHDAYKAKVLEAEYADTTEMFEIQPIRLRNRFVRGKIGQVYN